MLPWDPKVGELMLLRAREKHSAIAQCSLKYGWSASSSLWTYLLCTQLDPIGPCLLVDSCSLGQPRIHEASPSLAWTSSKLLELGKVLDSPGNSTWCPYVPWSSHMAGMNIYIYIERYVHKVVPPFHSSVGEHNSNNYGFCGWYIELVDAVHGLRKPIYNCGAPPRGSWDNHPPVSLCQMGHSSKR